VAHTCGEAFQLFSAFSAVNNQPWRYPVSPVRMKSGFFSKLL
jgi:hypothetical protein